MTQTFRGPESGIGDPRSSSDGKGEGGRAKTPTQSWFRHRAVHSWDETHFVVLSHCPVVLMNRI